MDKFQKLYEEFYDAFILNTYSLDDNKYTEIFKNPTSKELDSIKRSTDFGGIRLAADIETNDIYAFPGFALHYNVIPKLPDGKYIRIIFFKNNVTYNHYIFISAHKEEVPIEIIQKLNDMFPGVEIMFKDYE